MLKTAFFIAKRYLFSKKSTNVINIISGISVGGIAISVAAMIIILSAINGLEGLVETLSSKIDADIRITPVKGKTFDGKTFPFEEVRQTEGVEHLSPVVEELCIVKYNERFVHALLKGVEDEYLLVSQVGQHMEDGTVKVREGDFYFCSVDVEVAAALELYVNPRPGEFENVTLFAPVRAKKFKVNSTPFNKQTIFLSGVFNVNSDDELKPVVVARELAASMLEYGDEVSAIEMSLKPGADPDAVRDRRLRHRRQHCTGGDGSRVHGSGLCVRAVRLRAGTAGAGLPAGPGHGREFATRARSIPRRSVDLPATANLGRPARVCAGRCRADRPTPLQAHASRGV